jgi:hypothetical protein
MDSTDPLLAAVAGALLPEARPRLPDEPLDDETWRRLLTATRAKRLTGLLATAIAAGAWPATPAQVDQAYAAHTDAMATAVALEQLLLDVVDRLEVAGVPVRVLKGAAHAHLDYPDPAWRSFGDVDLLVRSADVDRTRDLLVASGGRRRYREPRPGFDRRFGKGMCIVDASGFEVDVHRTLCLGPFGLTIDLDELFAGSEPFPLGGRTVYALDAPRRFVHACVHAAVGRAVPEPAALRDVAQTMPDTSAGRAVALDLADRWRLTAVTARAVGAARATLAWSAPGDLIAPLDAHRPSSVERSWLAAYTGAGRSSAAQTLGGLRAVPGARDKLAYAYAVVWPSGAGRNALGARWRRGVEVVRARVTGRGQA